MTFTCEKCGADGPTLQLKGRGKHLCKCCRIYVTEGVEAMLRYQDEQSFMEHRRKAQTTVTSV